MTRRIATAIACACVVAGYLSATGSARLPRSAERWLGTWHTNFGSIWFYDVYCPPDDTIGCRIHGRWKYPTGAVKRIDANLYRRDEYRTLSGCWSPAPDGGDGNCGSHPLMYRKPRMTLGSGFWADCRFTCPNHHPWEGKRTSPSFRVSFTFTQHGFPDGKHVIQTQTDGAGALDLRRADQRGAVQPISEAARISHGRRDQHRRPAADDDTAHRVRGGTAPAETRC